MNCNYCYLRLGIIIGMLAIMAPTSVIHAQKKKGRKAAIRVLDPKEQRKVDYLFVDGSTELVRGDFDLARTYFQQVLEIQPEHHASLYYLAKISIEQRDYNAAIEYAKHALSFDQKNYWYYFLLRQSYEFKGDYPNAIQTQEHLLEKFPEKYPESLHLVELFVRNKDYNAAIKQLDLIETQFGFSEEIASRKFQLLMRLHDYTKALALSKQLLQIAPENVRYYQQQYEVYQALEEYTLAIAALKQLLEYDPDNGFALLSLADYYKSIQEIDKSDEYLFRAFGNPNIASSGKVRIIQSMLSVAQIRPDIIPRVKNLARILNNTHPGTAQTFAIQGEIFLLDEQLDSAKIYFRRSLTLENTDLEVWKKLVTLSYQQSDYLQLKADASEALEFYPNDSQLLFSFGLASSYSEDYDEAIYAFKKIQRQLSNKEDLLLQSYVELAKVYHFQQDYSASDAQFEKGLTLFPESDALLERYAHFLSLREEKLDRALTMIQQALSSQPKNPNYLDTYAWVLFKTGKPKEAARQLEKALALQSTPDMLEHYGDVLYRLGKKEEAIAAWEKAIKAGAVGVNISEKLTYDQ